MPFIMQKTYFIKTLGCAMNHSDSERIAAFLESKDFKIAQKIETANLVIINTCGIRQAAENRAYSQVHNLRKNYKSSATNHQLQKIVLTGCISHRADVQKKLAGKVDLFCEIKDFTKIFENLKFENCLEIPTNSEKISYLSIAPKNKSMFAAYVPIMTGCNNFCSYCVVPYARGREISRSADEIISEIKDLISKGYKQITLLGQNVNSYHGTYSIKPWPGRHETKMQNKKHCKQIINFAELLKMIDKIPGKFWITFISSHPKDMSDELISTITKLKKVCEWVHLPVQAGNDEILRKMNRKYTAKHYLGRIKKITSEFKKNKPDSLFAISSDIIVGFPAETKAQFEDSAKIMTEAKFDLVFFGQFSPRPGTAAWKMKDHVTNTEKERREFFLNEILKKTALKNNKKYLGKKVEVLVEKEKNGFYFGKTKTQKNIKFLAKKKGLIGKFTKVLVKKANIWSLESELN
jgi:tRNA-2-methylthio-N6-dimethylallyladenosine synthase